MSSFIKSGQHVAYNTGIENNSYKALVLYVGSGIRNIELAVNYSSRPFREDTVNDEWKPVLTNRKYVRDTWDDYQQALRERTDSESAARARLTDMKNRMLVVNQHLLSLGVSVDRGLGSYTISLDEMEKLLQIQKQ